MKLPGRIQDYIDGLELDSDEKDKLVDHISGLEDLPEDPSERQAKSIVRSAQRDLEDKENRIVRQKAPKRKKKDDADSDSEEEVQPDEESSEDDETETEEDTPKKGKKKIEEGLKLSFKEYLTEMARPTKAQKQMADDAINKARDSSANEMKARKEFKTVAGGEGVPGQDGDFRFKVGQKVVIRGYGSPIKAVIAKRELRDGKPFYRCANEVTWDPESRLSAR